MLRKGVMSFEQWCIKNKKKEYLSLWDYDLNKLSPNEVSFSISNKYYFKCQNNVHESYLYSIRSITVENSHGPQCPICNSIYQWCLDNNHQDIIDAWDDDKNIIDMKHVSKGSGKKMWFTFEYYSFQYQISQITNKELSPVDKYYNSLGYYFVNNYGYDSIKKYWSDINKHTPFEYDKGSGKKAWFKCVNKSYHSDYQAICYSFTSGCGCPMCASKIIHPLDSFAQFNIDRYGDDWLEKCWMDDNTVDPYKISANNSTIKVHIRCIDVEYHEFWITPCNYDKGYKVCHYCNIKGTGGKVHPLDSLGEKNPEILEIWSNKNTKTPFEYSEYSHEIIWLKCENNIHEDYKKRVADFSQHPDRLCPCCNNTSSYERKTKDYLNTLNYTILHEQNCTLYPINPKTNYKLPYDNEIKELKLIIEVMGKQHYELTGFHFLSAKRNHTLPEYEFKYSVWKDNFKKNYVLENGYYYLELPYYVFDDNTYITMIDDKINEIINLKSVETAGIVDKKQSEVIFPIVLYDENNIQSELAIYNETQEIGRNDQSECINTQ